MCRLVGVIAGVALKSEAPRPRLKRAACLVLVQVLVLAGMQAGAAGLSNGVYHVALADDGAALVGREGVAPLRFEPRFVLISALRNPKPELRMADLGERQMQNKYNVLCWETAPGPAEGGNRNKSKEHVADGFDPRQDQEAGQGRLFDLFAAGDKLELKAAAGVWAGNRIQWTFPEQSLGTLRAGLELAAGTGEPLVTVEFTPKVERYFSIGYVGAAEASQGALEEIWQPLIWQERRFPNQSYLTEAARCTLPATLVASRGVTWGVAADPDELPFMPLPTPANSRFGVAVRNAAGQAQPMIFAPILGGPGSRMAAGQSFKFRFRLHASNGGILHAYEQLGRGLFEFRDLRRNDGLGSLNRTLERTIDYAMSPWARFDEDLRGSAYETDVPGSVKNVSALHPLGASLVTDDPAIFEHRVRPMIEYLLSREKFLFTTDPQVKGQGASANLTGPCAPVSELGALYEMCGQRTPRFLRLAQQLFGKTRTLNLDDPVRGDIWQNALALYHATGERAWLDQAKTGADRYLAARLDTPQADFKDGGSRGMFFWTSYAPNWMELFDLYEATGERRYLEAARAGAHRFAQFIWLCPRIPDGGVTVNEGGQAPHYRKGAKYPPIRLPEETVPAWRLSEIGLTCESSGTSKGHRGIFLTSFAPWMLRLHEETGDLFLHDLARSAVVGRYTSFPGYHINTARTTVYEKPDFAQRPTAQINSTSSLHYNHVWPQIAMLLDYLVADALDRSAGAIDFPSHYAEGYAYMQSKVYGDRPGHFYGDAGVWLWMPKGLVQFDNPEINYLAARGRDTFYVALMNQSEEAVRTDVRLDGRLIPFAAGREYEARVWRQNKLVASAPLRPEKFAVELAPRGITAVAIKGLAAAPRLQGSLTDESRGWSKDYAELKLGGARATVLNFGSERCWAYVYLQERDALKQVTLRYSTGGPWHEVTDSAFPFEFSVALPPEAREFGFKLQVVRPSGERVDSGTEKLSR